MGRPKSNSAEYFSHYTTLRNHRKVKMLRNKFGSVLGYAFWCMMLEWLTEHDGLEWEYSELEIEMFASELGVSATDIPPMIDFCIKVELLFKNEDGFIYSESLNEYLEPVFKKRNREREKSKQRVRHKDGTFQTATNDGVSATDIPPQSSESVTDSPQSIVEYSRVEKSKGKSVKKNFTPPTLDEVKIYFEDNGYSEVAAERAFKYYSTNDWKDRNNSQIKNWKQKMIGVWFKDDNKKTKQSKMQY